MVKVKTLKRIKDDYNIQIRALRKAIHYNHGKIKLRIVSYTHLGDFVNPIPTYLPSKRPLIVKKVDINLNKLELEQLTDFIKTIDYDEYLKKLDKDKEFKKWLQR